MAQVLTVIAGGLSLGGFLPYVYSTVWGKTRPERATWSIWFACNALLLLSLLTGEAQTEFWIPVGYGFGTFVMMILAIGYGSRGKPSSDEYLAVGLATVFAAVTMFVSTPWIGLVAGLLMDFAGGLPTVVATYKDPYKEDPVAWGTFFLGNIFGLAAILAAAGPWEGNRLDEAVYAIYMSLGTFIITSIILLRRIMLRGRVPA